MFEAFRASRQELKGRKVRETQAAEEPPKPAETETPETSAAPEPPAAPTAAPARPQRRAVPAWHRGVVEGDDVHVFPLGERANVVFALSYNALIAVIVVFVVFSVLMAFVGYTIASRTTDEPAVAGPIGVIPAKKKAPVGGHATTHGGGRTVTPTKPKAYWRVQVLTVRDTEARRQALKEVMAELESQGIKPLEAFRRQNTGMLVLYAGAFKEDDREGAERLARQLRGIRVNGRDDLKDAKVYAIPQ